MVEGLRDTWSNVAFRHICFVRLFEGCYQGIQSTNLLYYLTYVLKLHGSRRSGFVVLVGMCNLVGELPMAYVVSKFLTVHRNTYRLQAAVATARVMNAAATVALFALPTVLLGEDLDGTELWVATVVFLLWQAGSRVLQAPFTFFKVGAQCWVVDEDIISQSGARREGVFMSVASAMQNFSRALAAALCFLGYGLAGLKPRDCDLQCEELWDPFTDDQDGLLLMKECIHQCQSASIAEQPAALQWYIRVLYMGVLPALELLVVFHTLAFPIKGARLAELYRQQASSFGHVSVEEVNDSMSPSSVGAAHPVVPPGKKGIRVAPAPEPEGACAPLPVS